MGAGWDLVFATVAMTLVFAVIGILTACFYASGALFTWFERRFTARSGVPHGPAPAGTPAEHVAVIAAALAMHGRRSGEEIRLLDRGRFADWSDDARLPSRPDAMPALRRTR